MAIISGRECLYVRHSWNFEDGLKTTKNNENRIVEVLFPNLIQDLIDLAKRNPHEQSMDSYIFCARGYKNPFSFGKNSLNISVKTYSFSKSIKTHIKTQIFNSKIAIKFLFKKIVKKSQNLCTLILFFYNLIVVINMLIV